MNTNRPSLILIVFAAIAALSAGCQQSKPFAPPAGTPSAAASADALTHYQSRYLGYSFAYPQDFTLDASKDSSIGVVSLDRKRQVGAVTTDAGVAISPLPEDPRDTQWYSGFATSTIIPGFIAYSQPPIDGPRGHTVIYVVPDGKWGYNITESWEVLGEAQFFVGQLDETTANHKRALELKPDLFFCHYSLSQTYILQGRPRDALPEIDRVQHQVPDWG